METIPFEIHAQPDDISCGAACLHAVYRYFGTPSDMGTVFKEVPQLPDGGGTLAVHLANHALARGYDARIITWNLQVFDPTWFPDGAARITDGLLRQAEVKKDPKLRDASRAYASFLGLGGRLEFRELDAAVLRTPLQRGIPIITGLSATFLYQAARERPHDQESDDIAGEPVGHFVVLTGYVPHERLVHVSDPLYPNPMAKSHDYTVGIGRVIGAVYLGALTHDANLLILEPEGWSEQRKS